MIETVVLIILHSELVFADDIWRYRNEDQQHFLTDIMEYIVKRKFFFNGHIEAELFVKRKFFKAYRAKPTRDKGKTGGER